MSDPADNEVIETSDLVRSPRRRPHLRTVFGLSACFLLIVGGFLPIWGAILADDVGYLTLIGYKTRDGVLILVFGLMSSWMVFRGTRRWLWVMPTVGLALLTRNYLELDRIKQFPYLSQGYSQLHHDGFIVCPGEPLWGWIVLLAGLVLLLVCAAWPVRRSSSN